MELGSAINLIYNNNNYRQKSKCLSCYCLTCTQSHPYWVLRLLLSSVHQTDSYTYIVSLSHLQLSPYGSAHHISPITVWRRTLNCMEYSYHCLQIVH